MTFDVIIIGGSTVGAALACALGTAGVRVALVEAVQPVSTWEEGSVDQRVFAITRASEKVFAALGVWDGISLRGVSPFRRMTVWDAAGSGRVNFDCAEIGEPCLGYVIEQRVIQAALWARVSHLRSVQVFCPATLEGIEEGSGRVDVQLRGGGSLSASLLVGADGRDSVVRAWAGLPVRLHDYRQQAIVATVTTELPHEETARQRFLSTGPLAFLPLRDGRCSIVWSTTPAECERLMELDDTAFRAELGESFEHALGEVTGCGRRDAFLLMRLHAQRYTGNRVVLAGDAAHAIHPLAGQGVNLGLMDVAALAEVLLDARKKGRDTGGTGVLRRYERWRKGANLGMQAAMDGFKGMFAAAMPPVPLVRNIGMDLFESSGPVKRAVMRHAAGLIGDLPRLARGIPLEVR